MKDLKRFEDLTRDDLIALCVELMTDGAEVQGWEVEYFAEVYGIKL